MLSVKFVETYKISFNLTNCEAERSENIAFSLSPRDGATSAISLTTSKDIQNWEVRKDYQLRLWLILPVDKRLMSFVCGH